MTYGGITRPVEAHMVEGAYIQRTAFYARETGEGAFEVHARVWVYAMKGGRYSLTVDAAGGSGEESPDRWDDAADGDAYGDAPPLPGAEPLPGEEPADAADPGSPAGGAGERSEPEGVPGASTLTVDLARIQRPGFAASGSITCSDGVKGEWGIDNYGRLALAFPDNKGYRPSAADQQAFMQKLRELLSGGY